MENIAINERQTLCLITKELNGLSQQNYVEDTSSIIESTKHYHFSYPPSLPITMPVAGDVINLSAGLLSLIDIGVAGVKFVVFWRSKVGSISSNTSGLLDQPLFKHMSDDNTELVLLAPKFVRSNWLLSIKSYVLKKYSFKPVKMFALDVKLSAVSGKTNSDKLITIKKIFYRIDGFGRVFISSKFLGIIRSLFTSEFSLDKAKKLAVLIVKKIPVNFPKLAVESVFSKFGKIYESSEIADLVAARWFVFMGKNSVCVTKAALFYTLPVRTMTHDFSGLMELYDEKICFIGHNPSLYVHDRCTIMYFADETSKLAAIGSVPVFKSVNLCWTGLSLACCFKCKHFGHISDMCLVGKTWAQIASGFSLHVVSLFSSSTSSSFGAGISFVVFAFFGDSGLHNYLAFLEHSIELLSDQISGILKKLSLVGLVSLVLSSLTSFSIASAPLNSSLDLNITVNNMFVLSVFPPIGVNFDVSGFSSSSSKVLTTKVGSLESKMVVLDVLVNLVLERLDYLCSGLNFDLVWKIATCNVKGINNFAKQDDIICWHNETNNLISIVIETKLRDKVHHGS
ncbi:hypothetical protein G9A89_016406 [Geosiphon pyriformis]|nr:hypothetical protein G9A89_016406 [Geosiphon pyriformis]